MTNNPSFANLNPPVTEINLLLKVVANARSYTIEASQARRSRQLDARWYCYLRRQANRRKATDSKSLVYGNRRIERVLRTCQVYILIERSIRTWTMRKNDNAQRFTNL